MTQFTNAKKIDEQQNNNQSLQNVPATQSANQLIESGVTDSGDIRRYVWQAAVNTWRSSLKAFFIGTGTETFAFAFYLYKPVGHNLTSEWDFLYNKAHNEYLNFLATTGIVGLGTYLTIIGAFILWFIKSQITSTKFQTNTKSQIQKRNSFENLKFNFVWNLDFGIRILCTGLFAGWISILITNFFGFSVVVTQLMLYLLPAMIFAIRLPSKDKDFFMYPISWTEKTVSIVRSAVASIAILLIIMLCIFWYADKEFAKGYHLSRVGYLPQAYQALVTAIRLNPTEPVYCDEQSTVLSTLALSAWKEEEATISQELASRAVEENDISLSVSPKNVNFWKTRTKVFYALSSLDIAFLQEAIGALETGITLSPLDPKMYYNLAILYGQKGDADKAIRYMKKSIELKPNYREGYYGLYVVYTEAGMHNEANQVIIDYLTNVDPKDEELQNLLQ